MTKAVRHLLVVLMAICFTLLWVCSSEACGRRRGGCYYVPPCYVPPCYVTYPVVYGMVPACSAPALSDHPSGPPQPEPPDHPSPSK